MEVLVEVHVVAEVRILLVTRVVTEDGAIALVVFQKNPRQARGELVGDVVDRRKVVRTRGAGDPELIAVVVMKLLQRLDDEEVDRKPDWPTPVRVAAEEAAVGFGGLIANGEVHAVMAVHVRL